MELLSGELAKGPETTENDQVGVNEHQQHQRWDKCVIFCHQKVGHVHSELPIVAFLRWQFCSVTKALLGAPFAAFHWLTFE